MTINHTPAICRDCGKESLDWYWFVPAGKKMKQPRCRDCHEAAVRRGITDEKTEYAVTATGRRVKVNQKTKTHTEE